MIGVQSQQRILTIQSEASLTDPPLIGGIGFGRSESPKPEWKQAQKPSAPSATLTPWRIRTLRGVAALGSVARLDQACVTEMKLFIEVTTAPIARGSGLFLRRSLFRTVGAFDLLISP
jgi:hypothetical protein